MTISKETEEQVCKDYLNNVTYKQICENNNISEFSILQILKRNNIKYRGKRKYTCDDNYFETIDTADKAYFMGFITGDGYLRQRDNSKIVKIEIELGDKELLEKFKHYLKSSHTIIEGTRISKPSGKQVFSCNLELTNNKLFDDLVKHGVRPTKSKDCEFSKNISDKLMVHYVRGLVDSDGGWVLRRTQRKELIFSFISSVYQFVYDFRSFLMKKCDLDEVKINSQENYKAHIIFYGGNVQTKRIYDYLYSDGGPWLDRKYELTTNYFNEVDITYSNMKNIRNLKMEHSYSNYKHNICKCDICRFCNRIYERCREKGIHLLTTIVTELSIKYVKEYNDSQYLCQKDEVMNKIVREIKIRKLVENIETNTNFESRSFKKEINRVVKPKEPSYLNQLLGFKS